jgi:competence transcription factor ComK
MKPPIIVDEKGPVYIFETLRDAELYLEPIDVKNNRYVAYDSESRWLRLRATEPPLLST